ncbi:MAG: hypothetical protein EZS28_025352 [Streblomastix strix]|uniref:Uncharacterized protein n=1 Tax=Streblomastix strix TaxID=222440 RepID=A0A5J4V9C2_9EUKA|nr:MAG: hypothetical protein EZS28_025352 [Streblomastix strix]
MIFFPQEYTLSQGASKRALIITKLSQTAAVINPCRTDENKAEVKIVIFDILQLQTENLTAEAKKIKIFTPFFSNLHIDENNSFYAFAAIYINGMNQLKAKLCIFPQHFSEAHFTMFNDWFKTIYLPPLEVKFVDVKSAGAFSLALTEDGKL